MKGRPELAAAAVSQLAFSENGFHVEGISVAGVETWLRIPEWSLAIDVGRSPEILSRCQHIALTHAHMDHAGGLAQVLAMRKLYSLARTTVHAPAEACPGLATVVAAWEDLHGHGFNWTLNPMRPGDEAPLGGGRFLRALPAFHVVPALGYAVFERRRKLRPEFANLPPHTLRELGGRGEALSMAVEQVLLAVSGDTRVTALEANRELREADVVLFEATFLDERRTVTAAHEGGHTHLAELVDRADLLTCSHFVPYHVSQIHGADEAVATLHSRVPAALEARMTALLPGERAPVRLASP